MTEKRAPSLAKRLLAAAAIGLILTGLVWFLEIFGALAQLERMTNDIESLLPQAREQTSEVVLVIITDRDYQQLFNGKSPLLYDNKGTDTGGNLQEIIDTIGKGHPAVIGVDIDTSDKRYVNLTFDAEPPIVWEQEISEEDAHETNTPPVLGGQTLQQNHSTGIPFLLRDNDGVVRFYARHTRVPHGLPSLPWEVVKTYSKVQAHKEACRAEDPSDHEPRLIHYSNPSKVSRSRLSAESVLALKSTENSPFKGKIVLLGGDYLGLDRHETPMSREMLGVEVLANIIETELTTDCKGGSTELSGLSRFLLLAFQNFVLVFVLKDWKQWRKTWAVGAIAIVACMSIFFFFRTILGAWRFVTTMACLLVIELAQKGKEEAAHFIWKRVLPSGEKEE